MTCTMNACHICTACAHDRHNDCLGYVRCPTDLTTNPCRCCQGTP